MLLGAEGISNGEEFTLWQNGKEEAQGLQEKLSRHPTLLYQLRCKQQILRGRRGGAVFVTATGVHVVSLSLFIVWLLGKTCFSDLVTGCFQLHKPHVFF